MPKIIIHSPAATFDAAGREGVARELTDFALDCERLPKSPFVKSTVWLYFNEYQGDAVFMGHEPASAKVVSVQVYVIEGGLDDEAKRTLIRGATEILGRHSGAGKLVPVYLVIHEVPEINWGIFGNNADLQALRASRPDEPALPL